MDNLPEDCIAKILSLTTPRDVCRSSAVSKIFRSAADSDDVWNQFLPDDLPAGFATPEGIPTRKQLFFSLVNNPLLLHDSQLSFSLERSGKKCYMIGAKALSIVWGDDQRYWQWISLPNNTRSRYRFTQVAELKMVWWLDITAKFDITLLSDDTLYAAYFVFTWNSTPYGFRQPVEASLVFADDVLQPSMVTLMQTSDDNQESQCADLRTDGWYEVKLGQFFKRTGDIGLIEMSLKETHRPFEKKGLIVHGIEIRPLTTTTNTS